MTNHPNPRAAASARRDAKRTPDDVDDVSLDKLRLGQRAARGKVGHERRQVAHGGRRPRAAAAAAPRARLVRRRADLRPHPTARQPTHSARAPRNGLRSDHGLELPQRPQARETTRCSERGGNGGAVGTAEVGARGGCGSGTATPGRAPWPHLVEALQLLQRRHALDDGELLRSGNRRADSQEGQDTFVPQDWLLACCHEENVAKCLRRRCGQHPERAASVCCAHVGGELALDVPVDEAVAAQHEVRLRAAGPWSTRGHAATRPPSIPQLLACRARHARGAGARWLCRWKAGGSCLLQSLARLTARPAAPDGLKRLSFLPPPRTCPSCPCCCLVVTLSASLPS